MDIQSLKVLMEIDAMQSLGSVQSAQNNSSTSSMFSEMLGQVLQASTGDSPSENLSSLLYSGTSSVFVPSNLNLEQSTLKEAISTKLSTTTKYGTDFDEIIKKAAATYNVPEKLISSIIKQESNFNPSATSSAGASGLMQLMPGTAKYLGVTNTLDPEQNIMGGAKYISQMLSKFGGNMETALAAYNAGPGAVKKYDGIPPYKETQNYVKKVMNYFHA
ncbi:lytic transglycosylase domain-containing protein [Psychrobacillus sp. NPDC096623]|uniref:lytic transglycosylase domain-containing protein n=1 Tax=Psychrobacillus sp. NPDC096623 TaxID=3364492 RepID=UPI00380722B6